MTGFSDLPGHLAASSVLTSAADLAAYSYDGALDRGFPQAVVLARDGRDVARAVSWCLKRGVSYTARGAGTNLSGGCVPLKGGVVISLAPLNRILQVDTAEGLAVVEPGTVNRALQEELEKTGHFYAPDPASYRVCTLGGNIAENAGGPRCLKYGVTTNHVAALEAVMPDGSVATFSSGAGPDVMSLLIGAEGTLGIVTKAWLKILPAPREIRTFLAAFDSMGEAVECVSRIIASGVLPRVLEAMDRLTVESVEAYCRAGYPRSEAVLLMELDGGAEAVGEESAVIEGICRKGGAREFRVAREPRERDRLWEGRRGAYAAMARLAPNVMVEDGVVPRDKLPEVVGRINDIMRRHRLTAGLLFHAGDGNIHPNVAYDERNAEETSRVKRAGREILQACVELGGSLSGEHGIGIDKRAAMASLFSTETLKLMRRVKEALDPLGLANPDKIIPLAGEIAAPIFARPKPRGFSGQAQRLVEKVRDCARAGRAMEIRGSSSRLSPAPRGRELEALETAGLGDILELDRGNSTLRVEAGISPATLHLELAAQGFWLKIPESGGTLGGLLSTKPQAGLREDLLGMRVLLSDGSVAELGGKVVKNVAGYDLPRLILGSWGAYALILDATFKLYSRRGYEPMPPPPAPKPFFPGFWEKRIKTAFDPRNLFNPWFFDA